MNLLTWFGDSLFYLAVFNLGFSLLAFGLLTWGAIATRRLSHVAAKQEQLPSISLVAAARNEERNIEQAVRSLMQLYYPDLEITLVNDRSTDRTGQILDRLDGEFPQLNVVHLTELPAGWLGKNHALQYGANRSRGQWLLFTDADIVFDPSTLRRAIAYAEANQVDHLAATPDCHMPSWLLTSFAVTFYMYFSIYVRLWAIRNPKSTAHIGIGAFNMIRGEVYRAVGGHESIRMRPDDDLKLGKIIKLAGYRQDVVNGTGLIGVEWYASVGETIRGLEKNTFSGTDYSVFLTVVSSAMSLMFNVWPFVAVFLLPAPTRWIYAAVCCVLWSIAWLSARGMNARPSAALGFPIAVLIFVYIQWRTMLLNHWQDGIRWRDTHYSLAELKANKV
jgi:cellulose synthase/poly-beta-1,6-N-acetylglucosamine synthase-like glycosyltransferase